MAVCQAVGLVQSLCQWIQIYGVILVEFLEPKGKITVCPAPGQCSCSQRCFHEELIAEVGNPTPWTPPPPSLTRQKKALCDFAIFLKLKEHLRGRKFVNVDSLQVATRDILKSFSTAVFNDAIHNVRWQIRVAII